MARGWFVIQVQTGFENKVYSRLLEKKNGGTLRDVLLDVRVPEEEVLVDKGKQKVIQKHKLYPGYVLAELDLPEDEMAWKSVYSDIRNIVGVGMFLTAGGGNKKPAPLTFEEVRSIFEQTGDLSGKEYMKDIHSSLAIGDKICINEGAFKNFEGVVDEVNEDKGIVVVSVEIFGRLTPMELEFSQVLKVD
ncbi:MAG: transcription termination/antitermination protein NusG [Brevinema sp.]